MRGMKALKYQSIGKQEELAVLEQMRLDLLDEDTTDYTEEEYRNYEHRYTDVCLKIRKLKENTAHIRRTNVVQYEMR